MRLIELSLAFLFFAAPSRFAGQWVASFKGADICVIEIEEADGKLSGLSRACKISVDQNGELIETDPPEGSQPPEPFLNPKADGDVLRYEQEDGSDRMEFEFKLTGDGKADLRLLNAPITIKPIPFTRR